MGHSINHKQDDWRSKVAQLRSQLQSTRPDDFVRRIELCRQAIKLIPRQIDPEQWATFQNMLGENYRRWRGGNRIKNYEQAIKCYRRTLQVISPHHMRHFWAEVQCQRRDIPNLYTPDTKPQYAIFSSRSEYECRGVFFLFRVCT